MKKPPIIGSDRFPGTTGKQSSGLTVSLEEIRKGQRVVLEREALRFRAVEEKHLTFLIEQAKAEITIFIHDPAFSGSLEEELTNYKDRLANEIANGGPSATSWEWYGHLRFLFSEKSPEDLRAAAHAYTKSLELYRDNARTILFLAEINKELQKLEGQPAPPENPLPAAGKDDISENTYGKQHRAAEMSDKIQKSIESGEHPGKFIFRELIEPSGQTLRFIAKKIDVHHTSLTNLKSGRTSLSEEMAAKLSYHFRTHSDLTLRYSTQQLLSLQSAQDAKKADQAYLASLPQQETPTPV